MAKTCGKREIWRTLSFFRQAYEAKQKAEGKDVKHGFRKEALAAIVSAEVRFLLFTKYWNRCRMSCSESLEEVCVWFTELNQTYITSMYAPLIYWKICITLYCIINAPSFYRDSEIQIFYDLCYCRSRRCLRLKGSAGWTSETLPIYLIRTIQSCIGKLILISKNLRLIKSSRCRIHI